MKDLLSIVRVCYENLPTLPGYFKKMADLLAAVNQVLTNQSMNQIDEEYLSEFVMQNFKAKFEKEYKNGEELFSAIRINLPISNPSLPDEDRYRLRREISTIILGGMQSQDGWYELVKINPLLKSKGVDYR